MTLKERNVFFKIGLGVAGAALAALGLASVAILPSAQSVYMEAVAAGSRRPAFFLDSLNRLYVAARFLQPSGYAVFGAILLSAAYALIAVIFIYRFFEKTQSPEILYFAFFVVSLSFEVCRVAVPLFKLDDLPAVYLTLASRLMLFGRCFGLFSLFAASIYAAGFTQQGQNYAIIILAAVSAAVALETPVDGFSWDTALNMITGYPALSSSVETGIALITLAGFLVSTLTRGSRAYFFISAGVLLIFVGRAFLLNADTWLTPAVGVTLLIIGTWLICTRLHSIYLWL